MQVQKSADGYLDDDPSRRLRFTERNVSLPYLWWKPRAKTSVCWNGSAFTVRNPASVRETLVNVAAVKARLNQECSAAGLFGLLSLLTYAA